MTTPAIAALVATFGVLRPQRPAQFLGLVPIRPARQLIGWVLVGSGGALAVSLLAIVVTALAGLTPIVPAADAGRQILILPLIAIAISVAAVGEELGWRGFLLPALQPLGTVPSVMLNGLIWGVWHAPLLLLGYSFKTTNPVSILLMSVGTILIGTVLAWLRIRSGSIWASSFAHGTMNASASLLAAALIPATPNIAASVLGWGGWVITGVVVAFLITKSTWRWRVPVDVTPSSRSTR
ncbi:CPBP family intramembrane glutamic endopeptidase [Micromonospora chokoriensis]